MQDVAIIGVGQTPVNEHWNQSLRELAGDAIHSTFSDASCDAVDAIYVGNAFGATFSSQTNLGTLIADHVGLSGVEAFTIEAGDASGGAALRAGYIAIASGLMNAVLVVGVEKPSDIVGAAHTEARNVALDADYESIQGATSASLAGLLMRRYMHEFGIELSQFEGFSINAHANGSHNEYAMYRNKLRAGVFMKAPMISDPINLFDGAPDGDGAASVMLASIEFAEKLGKPYVRIAGSAMATDTMKLQDRSDLLYFRAVERSTTAALQQAGISIEEVSLFELHDSFTIITTLSLEAMGLINRGEGWRLADGDIPAIALHGSHPISTFGGLKSRGNPAGAAGVYQAVETVIQLRGQAKQNQVDGAKWGLIQNLNNMANTAVTHILTTI